MGVPRYKRVLQSEVSPDDCSWQYVASDLPSSLAEAIKLITVTSKDITLTFTEKPINRALDQAATDKFILISFANFRFAEVPISKSSEYVQRLLTKGIDLNRTTYRFYGHSNSQLRSRTCFLCTGSGSEISEKVNSMGDFSNMSVAKRAKRIGLMFSAAEMGYPLSSSDCQDIPDVVGNGHVFTDGCGFISRRFAQTLSRRRGIVFRNEKYVPSVFQIRYKGYKGILILNPKLDRQRDPVTRRHPLVQFRDSMRKFKRCEDDTFSVVQYSKPYTFGKLNSEVVTLLSCLGISDEVFLEKQREYFDFIKEATRIPLVGFQFASYCNRPDLAEKLVLEGLESVQKELRGLRNKEWDGHYDKRDQERVRIMIRESRILFGVSDPGHNLAEDECQVRITLEGGGIRTLDGAEVIVARNPCLHPGDIRKLRAVRVPDVLDHLRDCIVFSVQGERPAASLMSGGDLDGDMFFVCWDKDLIPSVLFEPYEYPPAKEPPRRNSPTYEDMIKYFANYNNASLGRLKNLYVQWVRIKGADSQECRDLNALFSSCVDGERVRIPEHLQSPPANMNEDREPFILDKLCAAVGDAACTMIQVEPQLIEETTSLDMVDLLVSWPTICLSEFELFQLVHRWSLHNGVPLTRFVWHFDFGAFTAVERHWIASQMPDTFNMQCLLNNGLNQSLLITHRELEAHNLHLPRFHWKRIYSSREHDLERFFHFVETALEQFHCKLIILRIDERLTVAMYIPMKLSHNDDHTVDDAVRVLGFTRTGVGRRHSSTTVQGYQLYFDAETFQLFQGRRANTFVYLKADEELHGSTPRSSSVVRASIALQKINRSIQQHVGFVRKTPIVDAEIYVISNRDRVGHEILNIAMNQVDTLGDQICPQNDPQEYEVSELSTVEWDNLPGLCTSVLRDRKWNQLELLPDMADFELIFTTCVQHNGHSELSQIVDYILNHPSVYARNPDIIARILALLEDVPMLVIPVLNALLTCEDIRFPDRYGERNLHLYLVHIILLTTNTTSSLVLPELDRLLNAAPSNSVSLSDFSELVTSVLITTRRPDLVYELLHTFVMDHSHRLLSHIGMCGDSMVYFTRTTLGVALDRAGETAELCPCDDWGVPTGSSKLMINIRHCEGNADRRVFEANLRLDAPNSMRNGDHIRLRAATAPTNKPLQRRSVLDATVEGTQDGVAKLKLVQPAPPEVEKISWDVFPCGSMVTTRVMMDSLTRLLDEGYECCGVYRAILQLEDRNDATHEAGSDPVETATTSRNDQLDFEHEKMNESQKEAVVSAMEEQMTLVWGPPGTGKTTVVVEILMQLTRKFPEQKLLVTASTHNAVDNVLERLLAARSKRGIGDDNEEIVRVATEFTKVSPSLRRHTLDALVGSNNLHSDHRAKRQAEKRLKSAKIVFTTCTGAGLGILREVKFYTAVIDEASQLAEPNALAPLVKGPRRVILVGDHVQLRPTVRPQAELYQLDTSLFERLYMAPPRSDTTKVMLNVQYRMHPRIAAFPSREFYDGKLLDGVRGQDRKLLPSSFPWPVLSTDSSELDRIVLVPCSTKESVFSSSKKNDGQVGTCLKIVGMLLDRRASVKGKASEDTGKNLKIAVLTPYKRQFDELKRNLPNDSRLEVSTVDAFQGREADIVIFSTVRCNDHGDLGFVKDPRRMNVTLTRAKLGTIIVGDEATLKREGLWQKLVADLQKVDLSRS